MEGLTLTRRPALSRARSLDAELIARVAFGLLCLAFAIGFFVYPTYPNYDSYYSLLWGQEVLDLTKPGFEGFRVPTEHPLAIALGARAVAVRRERRPAVHRGHPRVLPVADLGRLPARPGRLHAARRRHRRRAGADALRLRLPRRPRLHRHPVHGAGDVGGRARGAHASPRRRRCSCCWRSPACCARRRGCWPASTGCGSRGGRAGGSARSTRRWPRSARSCGRRPTSSSPATRCSRCSTRAARRRTSGASARWPSCRPRSRGS